MRIVTGHQPVYLPWLGLLHKLSLADAFVFMDDAQYLTQDWNNRNRVKGPQGPFWLTVPVRRKASPSGLIKDILIDDSGRGTPRHWQHTHWNSLKSCYAQAPFWSDHAPFLEDVYTRRSWKWLVELNETLLRYFLDAFGIEIEWVTSSACGFTGRKSDRVLEHCQLLRADLCVLGMHGRDYLQAQVFLDHGISVYYQDYQHPQYAQRFGPFAGPLAALDLLLNCGPRSRDVLASGNLSKSGLIRAAIERGRPAVLELGGCGAAASGGVAVHDHLAGDHVAAPTAAATATTGSVARGGARSGA